MGSHKLTEVGIRIGVAKNKKKQKARNQQGFYISWYSQPLPENKPDILKNAKDRKNVLISRGHVSITMSFRTVGGCRCHLSNFFRLPSFRVKRKAKKRRRLGEGVVWMRKTVAGDETKRLSIRLKFTFSPRDRFLPIRPVGSI